MKIGSHTPKIQERVHIPLIQDDQKLVLCIKVRKFPQIIATSDGVIKRRRMQSDGAPECVPFLSHEFASRLANFHKMDISALPVPEATPDDLDPVQRARLRQFIERNSGDEVLLELEDSRFDSALGLTAREGDAWHPTLSILKKMGEKRGAYYIPGENF